MIRTTKRDFAIPQLSHISHLQVHNCHRQPNPHLCWNREAKFQPTVGAAWGATQSLGNLFPCPILCHSSLNRAIRSWASKIAYATSSSLCKANLVGDRGLDLALLMGAGPTPTPRTVHPWVCCQSTPTPICTPSTLPNPYLPGTGIGAGRMAHICALSSPTLALPQMCFMLCLQHHWASPKST